MREPERRRSALTGPSQMTTSRALVELLEPSRITGFQDGIALTAIPGAEDVRAAREVWERIYDFNVDKLTAEREDFWATKLDDHFAKIGRAHRFTPDDVYVEIGCGPSYIGEFLMSRFDVGFVGIDFNFGILDALRRYLDGKGFTKYLLVHADIHQMPLRDDAADFLYGGGVIEHFTDTVSLLRECRRVLRPGGVAFNTVPACNLSWPGRYNSNIPAVQPLRGLFERLHFDVLGGRVLQRHAGYELSFTRRQLVDLHLRAGFARAEAGPLPFHASPARLPSALLRQLYWTISTFGPTSPAYYVAATA